MSKPLTARGRALHWLSTHRGLYEQPPGSNRDNRADGITAAQRRLGAFLVGEAWCGVWACNAALQGGVKMINPARWAGVATIEDDARAHTNGFRGWTNDPKQVLRADLAVLFGRGVHVATVRQVYPRLGYLVTDEGNTSPGNTGSQFNGGTSSRRIRRISQVHGFALTAYEN
jgi:hypothetical protein